MHHLLNGVWGAVYQLLTAEGFPSKPKFEEKDVPDLSGKVYFVTGGHGGVGLELTKILFSKNAKVYIAGRSPETGREAVASIKSEYPKSDGDVEFLTLDLADLTSIKPAADKFLAKERRLDAVVHNAGIMAAPVDWKTEQGWDIQFGTNVVGPFVLQRHLQPLLLETAKFAPKDSVRVVFLSSIIAHVSPHGGVDYKNLESKGTAPLSSLSVLDPWLKYAQSKAANTVLAKGFAQKFKDTGVIASSPNPGNLKTNLTRHSIIMRTFGGLFLHPARFGGLTELYSVLSPELNQSNNGAIVIPWGRVGPMRQDIIDSCDQGGGAKLWDWLDEHTKGF